MHWPEQIFPILSRSDIKWDELPLIYFLPYFAWLQEVFEQIPWLSGATVLIRSFQGSSFAYLNPLLGGLLRLSILSITLTSHLCAGYRYTGIGRQPCRDCSPGVWSVL